MDPEQPPASRRKRLRHDERREQIIDTTLLCLARDGAEGASLRSVCRELGVAPSLVTYFFEGWHELLAAAYAALVERFMTRFAEVVQAPYPTARARMEAAIRCYLATDWAGEHSIGASIALWQLSRSVIDLRGPFSRYLTGRRKLLQRALQALAEETGAQVDVAKLTAGFMLMLDGVWLELSLNPGGIAERRSRQLCWVWLDAALTPPGRAPAARPALAARLKNA